MSLTTSKIQIDRISPEILHLIYPSQYWLTSSLIRMQEFYESSSKKFRNRYFTLESIIDYYSLKHDGNFSYFQDWAGFNLTSESLNNFYQLFKHDLTKKERLFFSILKKNIGNWKTQKYSVIATYNPRSDLNHELAHSFFYLYDDYKYYMSGLVQAFPLQKSIFNKLKKMGYGNNNLTDECQAYLSTSSDLYLCNEFNMKSDYNEFIKEFKNFFLNYKKKIV